ncbi:MAG: response regulator transcription factor [Oscillospiraceae bacterium]|nr:response regulator transcription factor [Oscillospiraceae bacterium]
MTRVLVVDDYQHTRDWCARLIRNSGRYDLVAAFANASNAEMPCMAGKVDLLVMDVCTADGESGLKLSAKLKAHYPNVKIIIMTSMPEHSFLARARAAGCESFWYKDSTVDLLEVMDRTVRGESVYPSSSPIVTVGNAKSSDFSARELEVIRLLAVGMTYSEIADELFISVNTVKDHLKRIYAKTGYSRSLQVVVDAVEHKLILPDY